MAKRPTKGGRGSPPPGKTPGPTPQGPSPPGGATGSNFSRSAAPSPRQNAGSGPSGPAPSAGKKHPILRTLGKGAKASFNAGFHLGQDAAEGSTRHVKQVAHEKIHGAVSRAEQDNSAVEVAHKAERLGEYAGKKGLKLGAKKGAKLVKSVPTAINKRRAAKASAAPPAPKQSVSLSKGPTGRMRVTSPGGTAAAVAASRNARRFQTGPPPAPPTGFALAKQTWNTPNAQLGSIVDFAPKQPGLLGKGLRNGAAAGKKGLQFGSAQASLKLRGKLAQESRDSSSMKAAMEVEQLAERPAKYVLNKGTKLAVKPVKKVGNKVRSAIRHKMLIHKQMFLAKHQGVAAARGAAMKVKAMVKAITRELLKISAPLIKWGLIIIGVYLICTMVIGPIMAALAEAGTSYVLTTTYPVAGGDMTNSTAQWAELQTALEQRIENIRDEFPDYDEYRFDVDPMEFDPFQLISYLASMHLEFTHGQVEAEIAALFGEVNPLQLIPETETRYDSNGNPYTWHILNVILHPVPFEDVVTPKLEAANSLDLYEVYMGSGGNQQAFGNPFTFNWLGLVSSTYGSRPNPTGPGYDFHTGLDIAAAEWTPIRSVQYGTVTVSDWHDLYGNYIVIRNESGVSTLYAHCNELLVSEGMSVAQGQIIATVGSTGNSSGPHLHIEVKILDERLDPIFFIQAYDE